MKLFQITSLKPFMSKLLTTDCFDSFLLEEAIISTNCSYVIDGHQLESFFTSEEWSDPSIRPYSLVTWKSMRELCFHLIKGKHTPVNFKFVLHLIPEHAEALIKKEASNLQISDLKAFVCTIKYDGSTASIISGTSLTTFLPDKSADILWDKTLQTFLTKHAIDFES